MSSIQQKFVESLKLRIIDRAIQTTNVSCTSIAGGIGYRSDLAVFLSNRFQFGIRVENIVAPDPEDSGNQSKQGLRSIAFPRAGIAVYKWFGDPGATHGILQTQPIRSPSIAGPEYV
ncbi:hypothetical protein LP421_30165 (plasmid) [Rhizobium sp. RCAM05350]|nr:hypothetical protein LP421_30165 [Rhizobium sp. RCAM05350]